MIDLPLFCSPTEASGQVAGVLDVDTLPRGGDVFPWPRGWMEEGPLQLADDSQSRIWSVSPWEIDSAEHLVALYGFVCDSVPDAKACADFFERRGFDALEY